MVGEGGKTHKRARKILEFNANYFIRGGNLSYCYIEQCRHELRFKVRYLFNWWNIIMIGSYILKFLMLPTFKICSQC